jgi:eukaryotic-like serine/threonine-protein kinase
VPPLPLVLPPLPALAPPAPPVALTRGADPDEASSPPQPGIAEKIEREKRAATKERVRRMGAASPETAIASPAFIARRATGPLRTDGVGVPSRTMSPEDSTPREGRAPDVVPTQVASLMPPPDPGALERPVDTLSFGQRYRVEQLLGEGGMGLVQLCEDVQVGRRVAIKTLRAEHLQDERMRQRFVREARIQGQLEHPSIVPIYDIGIDPRGAAYFTMKRVRGLTLREVMRRLEEKEAVTLERFSRRRLLGAFGSVCLAVDFAHRRGIVHRDLKPDNIMLGEYGEVNVLDWGIAKLITEDEPEVARPSRIELPPDLAGATAPGGILGTPGYMAPEQLRGEPPTPASDVYALGTILFELLSLSKLHGGQTQQQVIQSTLFGAGESAVMRAADADVPPELLAICQKATSLRPDERHRSARELQAAVERYLDGERDVELRKEMARTHAATAAEAARRAREHEGSVDHRRTAMREVGRALALDPDNRAALGTMVELLTTAPETLPPEVTRELQASSRDHLRWMGGVGSVAYLTLFAYVPLLLWMGVRDWGSVAAFFVPPVLCSALSFWQYRRRIPRMDAVLASMVISTVGFAMGSVFFGSAIVVPTAITVNCIAYAVHVQGWMRLFTVATGALALIAPPLLEGLGLVSPSYSFVGRSFSVLPRAIDFPQVPTLVVLYLSGIVGLVTGVLGVARVRDALGDAERRMYLYTWHLRELVPAEGRAATDPTGFPARSRRG